MKPNSRPPFDSLTLRAVVAELKSTIVGGQIQRIDQPTPLQLLLTVRIHGFNHRLLIDLAADTARMHLSQIRRERPPTPPTFCMALRKVADGAIITEVAQLDFDRVVEIRFGAPSVPRLVIELMGRHSNAILVGPDNRVADSVKRISARVNRFREILPGRKYESPPAQSKGRTLVSLDQDACLSTLRSLPPDAALARMAVMESWSGVSPFLANEIVFLNTAHGPAAVWERLIQPSIHRKFTPTLIRAIDGSTFGCYPLTLNSIPTAQQTTRGTMSELLDQCWSVIESVNDLESTLQAAQRRLKRVEQGARVKIGALEKALRNADRADHFQRIGELLLTHAHAIEEGAGEARVIDFFDPDQPLIVIPLDSSMSAVENAGVWFLKAKKARSGYERVTAEMDLAQSQLMSVMRALAELGNCPDGPAIRRIISRLETDGLLRKEVEPLEPGRKTIDPFQGKRIRRVTTPEGFEILVGENAEGNDFLTTRVAAPDDLWLHARAASSAHVVVRTNRKPETVPDSVIKRAASICAAKSAAKHSAVIPVDVTLKKYVRKPRGAAPGAVTYSHERTMHVEPAINE